jgi:hypothetical protein
VKYLPTKGKSFGIKEYFDPLYLAYLLHLNTRRQFLKMLLVVPSIQEIVDKHIQVFIRVDLRNEEIYERREK